MVTTPAEDLITWLRAQLDDDEQMLRSLDSTALNGIDSTAGWDVRAYVERGRAEVDAKRRIVAMYEKAVAAQRAGSISSRNRAQDEAAVDVLGEAVRLLAEPYADRPGYRDEWRPE